MFRFVPLLSGVVRCKFYKVDNRAIVAVATVHMCRIAWQLMLQLVEDCESPPAEENATTTASVSLRYFGRSFDSSMNDREVILGAVRQLWSREWTNNFWQPRNHTTRIDGKLSSTHSIFSFLGFDSFLELSDTRPLKKMGNRHAFFDGGYQF